MIDLCREMTKNVDVTWAASKKTTFSSDIKVVNRQLTVVLNMILTVVGAFVFGFVGLGIVNPGLEMPVRMIVGTTLATLVFFADLYFVVKTVT